MGTEYKYILSRSEYAKTLGISTDTLKKQMKRGHHKSQYILKDGRYLFTANQEDRPFKDTSPTKNVPVKKRNRGAHLTSTNPNYNNSFRKHNELKMLARLQGTQDKETLEVLPRAIQIAKQEKQQKLLKRLIETAPKNYGGMLNSYNRGAPLVDFSTPWKPLFRQEKNEYEKYLEDNNLSYPPGKTYY
jgi:hypothetical protein